MMLMSSSPTFSFLHWAAFPPSSICGDNDVNWLEMKEKKEKKSWKANRGTFRLRKGREEIIVRIKKKKSLKDTSLAAKTTPLKPIFGDIFLKLSASPWQRRPKEHLQNSPDQTSHRNPSHSCVIDSLCVCHSADCGSHGGEACVV